MFQFDISFIHLIYNVDIGLRYKPTSLSSVHILVRLPVNQDPTTQILESRVFMMLWMIAEAEQILFLTCLTENPSLNDY